MMTKEDRVPPLIIEIPLDNPTPDEARAVASNVLLYFKDINFDVRPTER